MIESGVGDLALIDVDDAKLKGTAKQVKVTEIVKGSVREVQRITSIPSFGVGGAECDSEFTFMCSINLEEYGAAQTGPISPCATAQDVEIAFHTGLGHLINNVHVDRFGPYVAAGWGAVMHPRALVVHAPYFHVWDIVFAGNAGDLPVLDCGKNATVSTIRNGTANALGGAFLLAFGTYESQAAAEAASELREFIGNQALAEKADRAQGMGASELAAMFRDAARETTPPL